MIQKNSIGIDLGGTNMRAGLVHEGVLQEIKSARVNGKGSADEVLAGLFTLTDQLINSDIESIGIGVPGLVDVSEGIVFDVVNIPSWKEIPLRKLVEERYQVPAMINNDANCFALGEFYFGQGKGCDAMVGLTIGTGLGCGLVLNKKLYSGRYCGAGEFGMIDYLDNSVEYYASGQFFKNVHNVDGELIFKEAGEGNKQALNMYEELGAHLGNAIKMILYALDVELIILGGSVRYAFPYFSKTMWESINTFTYQKSARGLQIKVSELENSGVLGAAALFYDSEHKINVKAL